MGLIFSHLLGRMVAAGHRNRPRRLAPAWSRRFGATDVIDASRQDVVEAVRA